jgi:hypothetical protein
MQLITWAFFICLMGFVVKFVRERWIAMTARTDDPAQGSASLTTHSARA